MEEAQMKAGAISFPKIISSVFIFFLTTIALMPITANGEISYINDSVSLTEADTDTRDADYGFAGDEQQGGGGLIGETVRILNGNVVEYRRDLAFASPNRLGFSFSATYNSRSTFAGRLGYGWTHTYAVFLDASLVFNDKNYLKIVDAGGRGHYFKEKQTGVYKGILSERSEVKLINSEYIWYRLDGSRFVFSESGQLRCMEDSVGNRLLISYDTRGRPESVVDQASSRSIRFNYNDDGLIESISGPVTEAVADGLWVTYGYDAYGNLASATYPDNSGVLYGYTDPRDAHNLTARHNTAGHLIASWAYDKKDRCSVYFNARGSGFDLEYENNTRVVVTDAYGVLRSYRIEKIGRRKRVTAMQGKAGPPYADNNVVRWRYDKNLNLVEVQYGKGTIFQYQNHDSRGNPRTINLAADTTDQKIINYTYHPRMNVILTRSEASLLGSGSKVTTWDYDDDYDPTPNENPTNLVSRVVEQGFTKNAAGHAVAYEYVSTYTYNPRGQLLTIDGPRSGTDDLIEMRYAPATGNLNEITEPHIGTTRFTESEYNAAGQVGQLVDVNGQSTRFEYDGRSRLTKIIFTADGGSKSASYIDGLLETTTDEDGVSRFYEYEPATGRLYRIYDAEDNYIEHLYDSGGNLIERSTYNPEDDRFSRKRWDYQGPDIPGKLWKQINYNDSFTEYRYDDDGNLKSITDPENRTSAYAYDTLLRLKTVIQTHLAPGDTVTAYGYDAHGNLASVTDAEGHETAFIYDDMGRLLSTTSPDTGITTFAYDEAGNLIYKTDANGKATRYSYDGLNRLTDVIFENYAENISYSYDAGTNGTGRLTGMTDPSGSTGLGYDRRGRLVKKISFIEGYEYELSRQLTAGNRVTQLTYPKSNHPDGHPGTRRIRYQRYPDSGKIEKVTTIRNSRFFTLLSDIVYSPFGAPSSMTHGSGGKINIQSSDCGCIRVLNPDTPAERIYTYYNDRNLKSIRGTRTPWLNQDFVYDSLGRLKHATGKYGAIAYTYDKVGNRLTRTIDGQTETYSYEPGTNRLASVAGAGVANYTYDQNGNPTIIGNRTYTYNQNNRLIKVEESGFPIAEYKYNALGQRVHKKVGDNTTIFHYDFDGKLIGESQPDQFIKTEYIYTGSNPIAMANVASGEIYYFLNNHLTTPELMTDKKGKVVWEATYRPFGEVSIDINSKVVNNFRRPGQYYDGEIELYDNYFRYYDPKTGRYLAPDPIGLLGGINLYLYALNNPNNLIDPQGLFFLSGTGNPGFVNVMPSKPLSWSQQSNNYAIPLKGVGVGVNMHNAIPGQFAILGPIVIIKGVPLIQRGLVSPILNLLRYGTPPTIIFPDLIEQLMVPSNAEASQCIE